MLKYARGSAISILNMNDIDKIRILHAFIPMLEQFRSRANRPNTRLITSIPICVIIPLKILFFIKGTEIIELRNNIAMNTITILNMGTSISMHQY